MAITTGRASQPSGSLPKAARVTSTLPEDSGPVEYERYQRACSWVGAFFNMYERTSDNTQERWGFQAHQVTVRLGKQWSYQNVEWYMV